MKEIEEPTDLFGISSSNGGEKAVFEAVENDMLEVVLMSER